MTKSGLSVLLWLLVQTFIYHHKDFVHGSFCQTDNDCASSHRQFCCRDNRFSKRKRCRARCIGQYCATHEDCRGINECCGVLNRCLAYGCSSECSTNSDCKSGTYCCRKKDITEKSVCLRSCVGEFCYSHIDCGGQHECCSPLHHCTTNGCRHKCFANEDCENNTVCCVKGHDFDKNSCQPSCLGESCQSDGDCGRINLCCGSDFLCTNKCAVNSNELSVWVIVTIALVICFVVLLPGLFGVYCLRKRGHRSSMENPAVDATPSEVKSKDVPLSAISKFQNAYRLPASLPPPFPPPPPPYEPPFVSSVTNPTIQETLDQTFTANEPVPAVLAKIPTRPSKERRKPPAPPAAKPQRVLPDPTSSKDKPVPPRPPRATRYRDPPPIPSSVSEARPRPPPPPRNRR